MTIRLYTDPVSGRLYYVDPVTGESRWAPSAPQALWPREYQEPQAQDYLAPPSEAGPPRRTGVKVALGIGGGLVALMVAAAITSHPSKTPVTLQSSQSGSSTFGAAAAPTSRSGSGTTTSAASTSASSFRPNSQSTVAVALAPKPATTTHSTKPALAPKPTHPTTAKPTHATTASSSKQSGCDPNYIWACVPIASDVDCLGGKGNGPAYVQGPVKVVGRDIYGLDADHDGIGCESG